MPWWGSLEVKCFFWWLFAFVNYFYVCFFDCMLCYMFATLLSMTWLRGSMFFGNNMQEPAGTRKHHGFILQELSCIGVLLHFMFLPHDLLLVKLFQHLFIPFHLATSCRVSWWNWLLCFQMIIMMVIGSIPWPTMLVVGGCHHQSQFIIHVTIC